MLAQANTGASKSGLFGPAERHKIRKRWESFNPIGFVKRNESWLYMSTGLLHIIEKMPEMIPADTLIERTVLQRKAVDPEIETALPPDHELSFATLAAMLEEQYESLRGILPSRHYPSLVVYLGKKLPVCVSLQEARSRSRWSLADWNYGEDPWPVGTAVIYPVQAKK